MVFAADGRMTRFYHPNGGDGLAWSAFQEFILECKNDSTGHTAAVPAAPPAVAAAGAASSMLGGMGAGGRASTTAAKAITQRPAVQPDAAAASPAAAAHARRVRGRKSGQQPTPLEVLAASAQVQAAAEFAVVPTAAAPQQLADAAQQLAGLQQAVASAAAAAAPQQEEAKKQVVAYEAASIQQMAAAAHHVLTYQVEPQHDAVLTPAAVSTGRSSSPAAATPSAQQHGGMFSPTANAAAAAQQPCLVTASARCGGGSRDVAAGAGTCRTPAAFSLLPAASATPAQEWWPGQLLAPVPPCSAATLHHAASARAASGVPVPVANQHSEAASKQQAYAQTAAFNQQVAATGALTASPLIDIKDLLQDAVLVVPASPSSISRGASTLQQHPEHPAAGVATVLPSSRLPPAPLAADVLQRIAALAAAANAAKAAGANPAAVSAPCVGIGGSGVAAAAAAAASAAGYKRSSSNSSSRASAQQCLPGQAASASMAALLLGSRPPPAATVASFLQSQHNFTLAAADNLTPAEVEAGPAAKQPHLAAAAAAASGDGGAAAAAAAGYQHCDSSRLTAQERQAVQLSAEDVAAARLRAKAEVAAAMTQLLLPAGQQVASQAAAAATLPASHILRLAGTLDLQSGVLAHAAAAASSGAGAQQPHAVQLPGAAALAALMSGTSLSPVAAAPSVLQQLTAAMGLSGGGNRSGATAGACKRSFSSTIAQQPQHVGLPAAAMAASEIATAAGVATGQTAAMQPRLAAAWQVAIQALQAKAALQSAEAAPRASHGRQPVGPVLDALLVGSAATGSNGSTKAQQRQSVLQLSAALAAVPPADSLDLAAAAPMAMQHGGPLPRAAAAVAGSCCMPALLSTMLPAAGAQAQPRRLGHPPAAVLADSTAASAGGQQGITQAATASAAAHPLAVTAAQKAAAVTAADTALLAAVLDEPKPRKAYFKHLAGPLVRPEPAGNSPASQRGRASSQQQQQPKQLPLAVPQLDTSMLPPLAAPRKMQRYAGAASSTQQAPRGAAAAWSDDGSSLRRLQPWGLLMLRQLRVLAVPATLLRLLQACGLPVPGPLQTLTHQHHPAGVTGGVAATWTTLVIFLMTMMIMTLMTIGLLAGAAVQLSAAAHSRGLGHGCQQQP